MRKWAILAFCLAWSGIAYAGPLEDADAAYQRQDYATAMRLWRPLADQGDAVAQQSVGIMYGFGQGVPQDYAEAMKWFRKAADQGFPAAQHSLGVLYRNGEGVPQDYAEALKWYRKAADQGLAAAQQNLALMYSKGEGVPQDYVLAHKWHNLAAANFSATDTEARTVAVKFREVVAAKMTPAQIAEAQKPAREWKPQ